VIIGNLDHIFPASLNFLGFSASINIGVVEFFSETELFNRRFGNFTPALAQQHLSDNKYTIQLLFSLRIHGQPPKINLSPGFCPHPLLGTFRPALTN